MTDLELLESIANYHISKGWGGIAYHYFITKQGKIYQTNWLPTLSYHVSGGGVKEGVSVNNWESVGICLEGDLTQSEPTQAQLQSLFVFLIPELIAQLGNHVEIKGHKELSATSCPGDWWVEE